MDSKMRKSWVRSMMNASLKTKRSPSYGRILDRLLDEKISPHIRSLSIRILEWMSCSNRRLKIHEILDGISIRPDRPYLESNTKLPRRVLDLCRPLIEDGPSNTLIFVHFSAQEYVSKAHNYDHYRISLLNLAQVHFESSISTRPAIHQTRGRTSEHRILLPRIFEHKFSSASAE
jgi:hypothetical protein